MADTDATDQWTKYWATAAEAAQATEARRAAFTAARDLLHGMDYEVEDVLVVADWLGDGQATLALKIAQQSADNYGTRPAPTSPDAATWISPYPSGGDDR